MLSRCSKRHTCHSSLLLCRAVITLGLRLGANYAAAELCHQLHGVVVSACNKYQGLKCCGMHAANKSMRKLLNNHPRLRSCRSCKHWCDHPTHLHCCAKHPRRSSAPLPVRSHPTGCWLSPTPTLSAFRTPFPQALAASARTATFMVSTSKSQSKKLPHMICSAFACPAHAVPTLRMPLLRAAMCVIISRYHDNDHTYSITAPH